MSSATIPLPWPKPPLTGNRTRGNPYARANEVLVAKTQACAAIRAARVEPMAGANVELHFRPADRRRRDADGMFPTLKVCQDALVVEGVLHDDSWVTVPRATCEIHTPAKPAAMWLTLTDPDAPPDPWPEAAEAEARIAQRVRDGAYTHDIPNNPPY